MDNQTRKITDDEFNIFVESIYRQQIEEEIMNSIYGKQIAQFEKLGIGIGIEDIVSNYIAIAGMKYNKVGNVVLEESLLAEVHANNLEVISKALGVDLTRLSQTEMENVLANTDYAYKIAQNQTKEEGKFIRNIDKILDENLVVNKEITEIIKNIEYLNIPEAKFALSADEMYYVLTRMGVSEEEAKEQVEKQEKMVVETFVGTTADVRIMEAVFYGHLIATGESELSEEEFMKYCNADIDTFKTSKFYSNIVDENGQISLEKIEEFFQQFVQKRNDSELTTNLERYHSYKTLPQDGREKFFKTLLIAYKSGDEIKGQNAKVLAGKFGWDVFDENGDFDQNKLQRIGILMFGPEFNIDETVEKATFNDKTFLDLMNRFEQSIIKAGGSIEAKSFEEVNKFKAKAKEKEVILCSKKEDITLNVLSGMNMTPEQIMALYCKFRTLELNERQIVQLNKAPKEFTAKSVNNPQYNGVAEILKKYILERPEQFTEYLSEKGEFKGKTVLDMLDAKKFSFKEETDIAAAFEHIRFQTKGIDKRVEEKSEEIKALNSKLFELREKGKENCTNEEIRTLFRDAKKLQKDDVLRTEILQKLKDFDPEMFDKKFKRSNVENVIGEGKAILYGKIAIGLRKAFVVMPQRIFNKNYRNMDIIGVDNSILKRWQRNQKKQDKNVANEKENNNPNNLPAVKKVTVFDKIKNMFKGKKEEVANNIEEKEEIKSEKETTQGQVSVSTGIRMESIDTTMIDENTQETQSVFDTRYKAETPVVQENSDQKDTLEDGERTSTDEGR